MKRFAYLLSAGLISSMFALACNASSTSSGTGTPGGSGGSGGDQVGGGPNTTVDEAGAGGTKQETGGAGQGGSDPFGGGGDPQGGQAQGGNEPGGQAQGGQAQGGNEPGGDDCQTCANSSCSSQVNACNSNPDCIAIFKCVANCQDQTCFDKCIKDNPGGAADFNATYQCLGTNCQEACSGGGGGGGDIKCTQIDLGDGATGACSTCGHSKCCGQLEACFNDDGCNAFNDCLVKNDCSDQACAQACAKEQPAGAQLYNAFGQCIQSGCSTECG